MNKNTEKSPKMLYPQCPCCGRVNTLHKVGNFYACRVCHRLVRIFGYAGKTEK